jgi:hypothetical protein
MHPRREYEVPNNPESFFFQVTNKGLQKRSEKYFRESRITKIQMALQEGRLVYRD